MLPQRDLRRQPGFLTDRQTLANPSLETYHARRNDTERPARLAAAQARVDAYCAMTPDQRAAHDKADCNAMAHDMAAAAIMSGCADALYEALCRALEHAANAPAKDEDDNA